MAASGVVVWDWDVVDNRWVWSENAEEVLGFPPGAFGDNFETYMKWVHSDDVEPINQRVATALKDQVDYASEYRVIRPDGEVRWTSAPGQVFRDSSGRPTRIGGTMMDITERKRAEEALRESEGHYRELVERTENLVTQVDTEGRFPFLNDMSKKVLGVSPEEGRGLLAFDFVHPEDRERTERAFQVWLRDCPPSSTFENRQVSRSGQIGHFLWTISARFDEKGDMVGFNSIARDITAHKNAEDALRAEMAFSESLVSTAQTVILVLDKLLY